MEGPSGFVWIIMGSVLLMNLSWTKATGGKCSLSADIPELKMHFEAIKSFLHDEDVITDISLFKEDILNHINVSEQCCFLLELGRFYLRNVFPHVEFTSTNTNDKKRNKLFHNLANSFLGLKIKLRHCHSTVRCPCGAESMTLLEKFKSQYYELEEAAPRKAVGDLNILFRWMEKDYMG